MLLPKKDFQANLAVDFFFFHDPAHRLLVPTGFWEKSISSPGAPRQKYFLYYRNDSSGWKSFRFPSAMVVPPLRLLISILFSLPILLNLKIAQHLRERGAHFFPQVSFSKLARHAICRCQT